MDENPYQLPEVLPTESILPPSPLRPAFALRLKRFFQGTAFLCAFLCFLIGARVLPIKHAIIVETLFAGAMFSLLGIICCNYFLWPMQKKKSAMRYWKLK
jgi:hypothetical protein